MNDHNLHPTDEKTEAQRALVNFKIIIKYCSEDLNQDNAILKLVVYHTVQTSICTSFIIQNGC